MPQPVTDLRPEDAAVEYNPYLDILVGGAVFNRRFEMPLVTGVEFGAFLGKRVALSLRAQAPFEAGNDQYDDDSDEPVRAGWERVPADDLVLLVGGSVGIVAVATRSVLLVPGVTVLRTDISDYGTALGASVPVIWVTRSGMRVGFDFGLMYGFGGKVREVCRFSAETPCNTGEVQERTREAASGFFATFHIGWGLGEPARVSPTPESQPW
jgi:hypothetical protein